jgi:hypothetical protein
MPINTSSSPILDYLLKLGCNETVGIKTEMLDLGKGFQLGAVVTMVTAAVTQSYLKKWRSD